MKTTYPHYSKKGDLKKVYKGMSSKNKAELDKFSDFLLRTNQQEKVGKILRFIVQFYHITEKDIYIKPTIQERDKFLALLNESHYKDSYKRESKIYLKKWLKWRWKDLKLLDDFPKLNGNGAEKVNEADLLNKEEIKKLISSESNLKWQTLLSVFYESGCRPEELLNLKWSSIKFCDDNITEISFITKKKTSIKSRIFPVQAATPYLKEWKNTNPNYKNDDYLFPSPQGNKSITIGGLNFHLKALAKKAKIEKNVFPYLFRFSKLTELYGDKRMDDRSVADLAGHSVGMAARYHKVSNKTARQKLIEEIYKTKEMTRETKNKLEKEIEQLKEKDAKTQEVLEKIKESVKQVSESFNNIMPFMKIGIKSGVIYKEFKRLASMNPRDMKKAVNEIDS